MKASRLTGIALATAAAGMFAMTAAGPAGAQAAQLLRNWLAEGLVCSID